MFVPDILFHLIHDIWILRCHVVVLMQIRGKVIKGAVAVFHHHFPVVHAQAQHIGLVEFPVEIFVLFLFAFAGEGGVYGNAVNQSFSSLGLRYFSS